MMTKRGAPLKLTPELIASICTFIESGNYIKTACQVVGINQKSYERWLKRGERETSGIYVHFVEAIKRAEAKAEVHMVSIVVKQAPESWPAAMTWLERRHSDRWGRKERRDVDMTSGGQPINWVDLVKRALGEK